MKLTSIQAKQIFKKIRGLENIAALRRGRELLSVLAPNHMQHLAPTYVCQNAFLLSQERLNTVHPAFVVKPSKHVLVTQILITCMVILLDKTMGPSFIRDTLHYSEH